MQAGFADSGIFVPPVLAHLPLSPPPPPPPPPPPEPMVMRHDARMRPFSRRMIVSDRVSLARAETVRSSRPRRRLSVTLNPIWRKLLAEGGLLTLGQPVAVLVDLDLDHRDHVDLTHVGRDDDLVCRLLLIVCLARNILVARKRLPLELLLHHLLLAGSLERF